MTDVPPTRLNCWEERLNVVPGRWKAVVHPSEIRRHIYHHIKDVLDGLRRDLPTSRHVNQRSMPNLRQHRQTTSRRPQGQNTETLELQPSHVRNKKGERSQTISLLKSLRTCHQAAWRYGPTTIAPAAKQLHDLMPQKPLPNSLTEAHHVPTLPRSTAKQLDGQPTSNLQLGKPRPRASIDGLFDVSLKNILSPKWPRPMPTTNHLYTLHIDGELGRRPNNDELVVPRRAAKPLLTTNATNVICWREFTTCVCQHIELRTFVVLETSTISIPFEMVALKQQTREFSSSSPGSAYRRRTGSQKSASRASRNVLVIEDAMPSAKYSRRDAHVQWRQRDVRQLELLPQTAALECRQHFTVSQSKLVILTPLPSLRHEYITFWKNEKIKKWKKGAKKKEGKNKAQKSFCKGFNNQKKKRRSVKKRIKKYFVKRKK